jgi:hypothetical protein
MEERRLLPKCKTPLDGVGSVNLRSGKEGQLMILLLLIVFLVVLRMRRIKVKVEFDF